MIVVNGRALALRSEPAGTRPFTFFPSMGEYPVYDDGVYDSFDERDQRFHAYREAVAARAAGKVVLDIGTGRDALWAVTAARAGARHVYAVEEQPGTAAQASQVVADAGLADRITVIRGRSTEISLPERAEVCVSEIVGNIASAEGAVAVLADAGKRLCTDDCAWIPFRIQTWAAAVDLSGQSPVMATESLPYVERIFAAVGRPFDLRLCLAGPVGDLRISSVTAVESIVFDGRRDAPASSPATSTASLMVEVAGARATGLLLWSRIAVTSGSRQIDTLAGDTRGWAPVYVPLGLAGVPVRQGDRLTVALRSTTSDDGIHPDYQLVVSAPGGPLTWSSPYRGSGFRRSPLYEVLFPVTSGF